MLLYIISNIQQPIHNDNLNAVLMLDLSALFDPIGQIVVVPCLQGYSRVAIS